MAEQRVRQLAAAHTRALANVKPGGDTPTAMWTLDKDFYCPLNGSKIHYHSDVELFMFVEMVYG